MTTTTMYVKVWDVLKGKRTVLEGNVSLVGEMDRCKNMSDFDTGEIVMAG